LNRLPQGPRVAGDDPHARHLGTRITCGTRQRVRVDIVDLAHRGIAVDVHQLVADTNDRHAGPRVGEHFRATDRGKQPHLGRADRGALTDSDVAGLHILPGTTYVSRRRHRVSHLDV